MAHLGAPLAGRRPGNHSWFRFRRRMILHNVNVRDQAVTLPWDRLDVSPSPFLPERLPQQRDVHRQVRALDEAIGPDRLHQFVSRHQATVVFDQVDQGVERLGSERHQNFTPQEALIGGIQRKPIEREMLHSRHLKKL